MKLIDEKEVEEAASEWLNIFSSCETKEQEIFVAGVSFAEQKLQPLIIKFKEWCDENEHELRLYNIVTNNPALTTEQLLEQFLNRDK